MIENLVNFTILNKKLNILVTEIIPSKVKINFLKSLMIEKKYIEYDVIVENFIYLV